LFATFALLASGSSALTAAGLEPSALASTGLASSASGSLRLVASVMSAISRWLWWD